MRSYSRLLVILLLWTTWALRIHNSAVLGTQADEGVHVTAAEQVAAGNATLYKDLFENRTPGGEWLLAGLFRLTGSAVFAARILAVTMATLTAATLYKIGRFVSPIRDRADRAPWLQGLAASALFSFAPLAIFWGRFMMLEHFAAAAAAISILPALRALQRKASARPAARITLGFWLASGVAAGLAVVFKQSELVLVPTFAAVFLLLSTFFRADEDHQAPTRTLIGAGVWTAGFIIIIGTLALLLRMQGALGAFLQFVSGVEQVAPLEKWQQKIQVLGHWSVRQPIAPLAVLGAFFVAGRRAPGAWLVLLWGFAEAGALLLPGQLDLSSGGFSHYVIPALAPGAVLAGIGLQRLRMAIAPRLSLRTAVAALLLFAVLLTVPGWLTDVRRFYGNDNYPQPTTEAERAIGRATSLVSVPREPIVVIGNAIFYHWARRAPASRFFHWPGYLSSSSLAAPATSELTTALQSPQVGAVLLSRLHMRERLPESASAALWQMWTPAALFTYPYQDDVLLFLPRAEAVATHGSLATVGQAITLQDINARPLDANTVLVRLTWQTGEPIDTDYTVFVHVMDENRTLIAQDDSVPAVGFRPTSTWRPGQPVIDYHWLELPDSATMDRLQLSLGLYEASSGQRLPVTIPGSDGTGERDSYVRPLDDRQ